MREKREEKNGIVLFVIFLFFIVVVVVFVGFVFILYFFIYLPWLCIETVSVSFGWKKKLALDWRLYNFIGPQVWNYLRMFYCVSLIAFAMSAFLVAGKGVICLCYFICIFYFASA